MTQLSNIFIGDRVVQQVYLNDALMYQSNGWQALPTTPQEQWVKSYPYSGNNDLFSSVDKDNNIILAQGKQLIKIDPEGSVIWQNSTATSSNTPFRGLIIDKDNIIWCYIEDYLYEYSSDGKMINSYNSFNISANNFFAGFNIYNDKIYLYTYNSIENYYYLNVLDKQNKKTLYSHVQPSFTSTGILYGYVLPVSDNIIYIAQNVYGNLYKFNTETDTAVSINLAEIDNIGAIAIDSYKNFYLIDHLSSPTYGYRLHKYNSNCEQLWCQTLNLGNSNNYSVFLPQNIDNAIYTISSDYDHPVIEKYETDGTFSWKIISTAGLNSMGRPAIDGYGNVYVPNLNNDGIELHKLINLKKEN